MGLFTRHILNRKKISEILDEEAKNIDKDNISIEQLHADVEDKLKEQGFIFDKKHFIYQDEHMSLPEKLADSVAKFGGSWKFVTFFGSFIIVWMFINIYFLATRAFDPYPFILLNLILSCLAAIQAPIIMMSQNRQAEKDRRQQEINIEKDIVDFKQDRLDLILDQKQWQLLLEMNSKIDS
ncbi:MAG: DUF1003 domain-containing protein, partial [Candidatus Woesearchaeota archaeon]